MQRGIKFRLGGLYEAETLDTKFPLPTLLYMQGTVKLCTLLIIQFGYSFLKNRQFQHTKVQTYVKQKNLVNVRQCST